MSIYLDFLRFAKKYWKISVLFLVIVSLVVGVPRTLHPYRVDNNNEVRATKIVGVENNATYPEGSSVRYEDYSVIWTQDANMLSLMNLITQKYDMKRIDNNWYNDGDLERINWLKQYFNVNQIEKSNLYQISIQVTSNPSDFEYTKSHLNNILSDYYTVAKESTHSSHPESSLVERSNALTFSQNTHSNIGVILKYYLVGLVLAALLAILILIIMFNNDKRVQSVAAIANKLSLDRVSKSNDSEEMLYSYIISENTINKKNKIIFSSSEISMSKDLISKIVDRLVNDKYHVEVLNLTREKKMWKPSRLVKDYTKSSSKKSSIVLVIGDLPVSQPTMGTYISDSSSIIIFCAADITIKRRILGSVSLFKKYSSAEKTPVPICLCEI